MGVEQGLYDYTLRKHVSLRHDRQPPLPSPGTRLEILRQTMSSHPLAHLAAIPMPDPAAGRQQYTILQNIALFGVLRLSQERVWLFRGRQWQVACVFSRA